LLEGAAEYEFRTTCVPGLVAEQDIRQLGELLRGARGWVLQQFVPHYCLAASCRKMEPYPVQKLESLAEVAREYVPEVTLRGL